MTLRGRALDALDALLDLPRETQDARVAAIADRDPELAAEIGRLIAVDRQLTTTGGELRHVVGEAIHALDQPASLGRYQVLREIGRGGMGVVYEAEQSRPKRRVALKTMPTLQVSAEARARFEVEVQALARVQHPGIPQVYEVFDVEGRPVVAMELVEGRRLDVALRGAAPALAARVLQRVAEAIAHVHDRGVVHRDLKPSNILVGPGDQPKVLDFGIAALGGGGSGAEGTPRYMAPEQGAGRPHDARVDVYALGVMGRELLEGSRLRPRDLRALLDRATQEDPARRTPSAGALADDLRRWRTLRPLRSVPTPWHRRVTLLARRAPLATTLGAVGALLALVVAVILVSLGLQSWDASRMQALREHAAAERLDALQRWAEQGGRDAPSLEETFQRLVESREMAGTAALSDAWSWWAADQPDAVERLAALGKAWVSATSSEQSLQTRAALARETWSQGRWHAATPLAVGVEDRLPRSIVQGAAVMRGDLLARPDLVSESARPLLRLLDQARPETEIWEARAVVGDHWLRARGQTLLVSDRAGHVQSRLELPPARHGRGLRLTAHEDRVDVDVPGRGTATYEPGSGHGALAFEERPARTRPAAARRGDGTVIFMAVTPGGLEAAVPGEPPRIAIPAARIGQGAPAAPVAVDLDADGSDEVLVPVHGWRHTGLQTWDLGADPPAMIDHREEVAFAAVFVGVDPPRILVAESSPGTTPMPFRPRSDAPVRTVRALTWDGQAWQAGPPLFSWPRITSLALADLDGDGIDDLIVGSWNLSALLRGLPDGGFSEPLILPELREPLVVQADDDEAMELWFLGSDLQGAETPGVLLGLAGASPLTASAVAPTTGLARPVPRLAAPEVAERWDRVAELARVGLWREAVRGLERLGREPAPVGPAALEWGLDLAEARPGGEPGLRRRLALELRAHPGAGVEELARATRVLRQAVHHVADRDLYVVRGPTWPVEVLRPEAVSARLDGHPELALDGGADPVLAVPFSPTEGPIALELELGVQELDFSAGAVLALQVGDSTSELLLQRVGGGAPSEHRLAVRCGPPDSLQQRLQDVPTGAITVGLSWDPEAGSVVCRVGEDWLQVPADLGEAAPGRWVLGSLARGGFPLTRARLRLDALRMAGAVPSAGASFDGRVEARARRAQVLADDPDPERAAVGLGRLGRPAAADLAPLDVDALARLLREDPDLWLGPTRTQRPEDWAAALGQAIAGPARVKAGAGWRVLRRSELLGLDPLDPDQRLLLVDGAWALWESGDGLTALRLLDSIPRGVEDAGVWHLRAKLSAVAGDEEGTREALARWRALAEPSFEVEQTVRHDPLLARYRAP